MHPFVTTLSRQAFPLKRAGVVLLVALVLLLGVLDVFPAAHGCLHADAHQAEHVCAVTLFAHGVTSAVVGVMLWVVVWRFLMPVVVQTGIILQAPDFRLLPARGPPLG